jgi:hypothetical protein
LTLTSRQPAQWGHDRRIHGGCRRTNQRRGRNYDDMVPGLSQYVHDAIVANCERVKA